MEFLDPLFELAERAFELESGSPLGITNLFFVVVLAIAFASVLVHELFLEGIDFAMKALLVIVNAGGRIWAHHSGARWKDFRDENPPPRRTASWKLLTVLAIFAVACPITLALTAS